MQKSGPVFNFAYFIYIDGIAEEKNFLQTEDGSLLRGYIRFNDLKRGVPEVLYKR